jgi:hypothetical protein
VLFQPHYIGSLPIHHFDNKVHLGRVPIFHFFYLLREGKAWGTSFDPPDPQNPEEDRHGPCPQETYHMVRETMENWTKQ